MYTAIYLPSPSLPGTSIAGIRYGVHLENDQFIHQSPLTLLNDGSPTHSSIHNTLTHVDLTLASATLALGFVWFIESSTFGSDHFPIITTLFDTNYTPTFLPKFKLDDAN